ncbi:transketolase [Pyrofollis japonicus]|uniref:transketolase n=1 Tax=Pyrofollis japonicus TaxID=3060460 RepID=UPI00295AB6DE|nr:transketolase [Pyrofollis japonicus]BEP17821.1 transketolase [Pyrofollis japonicus]
MPIVSRLEVVKRSGLVSPRSRIQFLHSVALRARDRVLRMASVEKSIHVGSSLSSLDILNAILVGRGLQRTGSKPTQRDWLILSKGHAVPALYALLVELGKLSEEDLDGIRDIDGLEGHPDNSLDGVDVSTGSLGQGLSIAAGIAYAMRLDGTEDEHKVFVVLGDGELDEGQVWEAAATIPHLGLRNVVAIVDNNGYQLDGATSEIKNKGSLADRFQSLGWQVLEVDGHSYEMLLEALEYADASPRPVAIIAHTRRGNGLGLLEATGGQHV